MHLKGTALCEPHENAKYRVSNNMIEMCRELKGLCHVQWNGKSRKTWWTSDKHKVARWGKSRKPDVQCQWVWMPEAMTMNDKAEEKRLWTPKERKIVTLNA